MEMPQDGGSDGSEPEEEGSSGGEQEDQPPPPTQGDDQNWFQERLRRQRLLNENQVLASAYFVRRMKLFMKHIISFQPLMGGKLNDYVIRYETQGRGSVHAHMLWWVDFDPRYVPHADVIRLPIELLQRFGLVLEVNDPSSSEAASRARMSDEDEENLVEAALAAGELVDDESRWVRLYNETYLNVTNSNIWALKKPENIRAKLYIGIPPLETLT